MANVRIIQTDWKRDAVRLSAVRRAVFIEEQGVPEAMEWDAADAAAIHFLAEAGDGTATGCARLLTDGHIGRMAVLPQWRGQGIGRDLLDAILLVAKTQGHRHLRLSAQTQAAPFYSAAGFVCEGEPYVEAGIPHCAMSLMLA